MTEDAIAALFGAGYTLTPDHPLSQAGQFAAKETVSLVGPRNHISEMLVRVDKTFRLEMHIDTYEANAAGLQSHDIGTDVHLLGMTTFERHPSRANKIRIARRT